MVTENLQKKAVTVSFCENYIEHLTRYILENFARDGHDLSKIAIVFGGKRPELFLKRELARRLKRAFVPPVFFTIDELVAYSVKKTTPFSRPQDLDQSYEIYKLTKKLAPHLLSGRQKFSQFLPWAREILAFIEQLDLENVDEKSLQNIKANAQIGYSVPEDINGLLKSIVLLRGAYHSHLEKYKVYPRGYQYLKAAQSVEQLDFQEFDQILFCNFFYFNQSERTIVKSLYEKDKASLIFQGDARRWPILNRIARELDITIEDGELPDTPQFKLQLYKGFDAHSQSGHVREIVKNIPNLDKTVIVLPNTGLLIPLLSELAGQIENFNVSMGYALTRSSLSSLLKAIFAAQLSLKDGKYYAKDYLKVLRHPFVKNLQFGSPVNVTRVLIHKIEELLTGKEPSAISGSLYISLHDISGLNHVYVLTKEMLKRWDITVDVKELKDLLEKIHELVFRSFQSVSHFKSFAAALRRCLDALIEYSFLKSYPLNLNIATRMYAVIEELENLSFQEEEFDKEDMFKIFENRIANEKVSFIGSPLKDLQILGLFETRSLNFDHVIVADVNEGVLPKLSNYEPLIPREVMISLNLDRLELEEEIQRYQFMRLISNAKNVHLVYQESKDKEKSRFIEELIWEQEKKEKKQKTHHVIKGSFDVVVSGRRKEAQKTPEIMKFLKNHCYSASSVNMYLRNPYEFFQNYVLGLREQEDLLDEPEGRHVGTFIHEVLEESFKPFINKMPVMSVQFKKRMMDFFEERFAQTFEKSMKSDAFLLKGVIAERLKRFLENEELSEARRVKEILFLEHAFEDTLKLSCGDVRFKYIVDRVDRMEDGSILLVDYKTGAIDQMPKNLNIILNAPLSRKSILQNVRSVQIPLYFLYLIKQFPNERVNAALYNLRTLELNKFIDGKTSASYEDMAKAFMGVLDFVMKEILDPEVPFIEDLEQKYF